MESPKADEKNEKKLKKAIKETIPGIIYLSRIPTGMNVKKIRHVLGIYGEIGRIFLQPDGEIRTHVSQYYYSSRCIPMLAFLWKREFSSNMIQVYKDSFESHYNV